MPPRKVPRFTMRTRHNTIRVSPESESSQSGASDQQHTPPSSYDSAIASSEKNTLFLPKELKLGGPSNWEQYSPAQKAILRINGLEDAVFGNYPSEEHRTMDQKIRAAKAAVSIRGNCTGEALSQLVGIEDPQEMFNILQAYCVGTGPVLLQTTLYQFIRIKTNSYETIPQFNVDFERLVKLLLEQKEPISDTLKKVVYLAACENEYPDWTARQRALLRSEHPPTIRSMQQDLIDENRSSDDEDRPGSASAYWVHGKKTGKRGSNARNHKSSNRHKDNSKNSKNNASRQEANHRINKHKDHVCTNCRKKGHHENDCWFTHKDKRPDWAVRLAKEFMEYDNQQGDVKNLHIKESNHMTVERSFMILEDEVSNEAMETCKVSLDNINARMKWLFDTGSSVHICNDRSLFSELQPATRTVLITGGGKVFPSGRGTVEVTFVNKWQDEVTINLKDTLYIPEFPVNVMSGLRLYRSGGWIDGNDLYDPTGDLVSHLYIGGDGLYVNSREIVLLEHAIHRHQPKPQNYTISSTQCLNTDLWHRRLGHINPYQVSQTAKITKGMFCDKRHNHKPFNYCLACDVSKALRWSPRNKRRRASKAGFLHVDTFKVNPLGINGQQWGMIVTDDRHRMRWAYTAVDGLTPLESFLNEVFPEQDNKPNLSGERICGSQVTVHIPQERRLRSFKFGPRGETGIYLCMEGSQIYTCWVPSRRKGHQLVRSTQVTFYEKVGETEHLTETEHDVEPTIRTNGAPISSRPQSVLEQIETPSSYQSEVNNLQHAGVHNPQHEQTTTSRTSVQLPDPRKAQFELVYAQSKKAVVSFGALKSTMTLCPEVKVDGGVLEELMVPPQLQD
ncbi:retrotransposase [Ilyonectria robusta]